MPSWRRRLQNAAASVLSLPQDTLSSAARITCVDANAIVVENVAELEHVSATEVRLNLGNMLVRLCGRAFEVNLVSGREVHLTGRVESIHFTRMGDIAP